MAKANGKIENHTVEKRRKRKREKIAVVETDTALNMEDNRMKAGEKKKEKSSTHKKRKNRDKNLVGKRRPKGEVDLEEKSDGVVDNCPSEARDHIQDFKEHGDADTRLAIKPCKSKKAKKKRNKEVSFVEEVPNSPKEGDQDEIYTITSGDADCSNGMKNNRMKAGEKKKEKSSTNKKRKNLVGRRRPKGEVDLQEKSVGVVDNCPSKARDHIQDFKEHGDADTIVAIKSCRSKKAKKKRNKEESFVEEVKNSLEEGGGPDQDEIYDISSGDEDCSKGMKKWIMEYHQSRPGLKVLQDQIDDFIIAHEEKLEEERREREARAAEGGWTVVVQHKGRKKTTDSESGVAVGSVAQLAVENKMAKKKPKEVGIDFYRFQKREAQRNEIMMLQSKFEEDKKRLQQLRAARKFRPY